MGGRVVLRSTSIEAMTEHNADCQTGPALSIKISVCKRMCVIKHACARYFAHLGCEDGPEGS